MHTQNNERSNTNRRGTKTPDEILVESAVLHAHLIGRVGFPLPTDVLSVLQKLVALQKQAQAYIQSVLRGEASAAQEGTAKLVARIDPKSVVKKEELGSGTYGKVYKVDVSGTLHAAKYIPIKGLSGEHVKLLETEADLMREVRHKHSVQCVGTMYTSSSFVIISELCDTDLFKEARCPRPNARAFVKQALQWFCELAQVLLWLHDVCHLVHRDIKPANVLLKDGHVKLGDYGFTVVIGRERASENFGSPYYMAPELFLRTGNYGKAVDVYAYGITLYEVLLGDIPFDSTIVTRRQLMTAVLDGVRPRLDKLGPHVPERLKSLMASCWQADPAKRPSMRSVFEEIVDIWLQMSAPSDNPALAYWKEMFGSELVDAVPRARLPVPPVVAPLLDFGPQVTLEQLGWTYYWYGDWLHGDPEALDLMRLLAGCEWFEPSISQKTEARVQQCMLSTGRNCFLVRPSPTNPRVSPFTIFTAYTSGVLEKHRVVRVSGGFGCLSLGEGEPVTSRGSLIEFIRQLRHGTLRDFIVPAREPSNAAYAPS